MNLKSTLQHIRFAILTLVILSAGLMGCSSKIDEPAPLTEPAKGRFTAADAPKGRPGPATGGRAGQR